LDARLYFIRLHPELHAEISDGPEREIAAAVEAEIRIEIFYFFKPRDVRRDKLRIIRDDRAVIVIIRPVLVEIIRHARIEYRVYSLIHQRLDVAVHELGGVAGRIGRYGILPLDIERPRRFGGRDDLEAERREEGIPEREKLIHIERHRYADFAARGP
jgi:hypothetical protein